MTSSIGLGEMTASGLGLDLGLVIGFALVWTKRAYSSGGSMAIHCWPLKSGSAAPPPHWCPIWYAVLAGCEAGEGLGLRTCRWLRLEQAQREVVLVPFGRAWHSEHMAAGSGIGIFSRAVNRRRSVLDTPVGGGGASSPCAS